MSTDRTEAKQDSGKKAGAQLEPGDPKPEPNPGTPYAEQVNNQDKTEDKPDSGQNEDG